MLAVLAVLGFFALVAIGAMLLIRSTGGVTGGACGLEVDVDRLGRLPSWAQQGPTTAATRQMLEMNRQAVARKDSSGGCFDFVMYGDSITAFLTRVPDAFRRHFGDLDAVTLGVGGNTVEQLAWRIIGGRERPARPPRCVALLIGINNTRGSDFGTAAARIEELVRWLQDAYPLTKLVLMALLPAAAGDVRGANARLREVARRTGVVFAECGQDLNPADKRLFSDRVHPTTAGHDVVLGCLRKVVDRLIGT